MAETSTSESLPVARLLGRGPVIASGVPEGLDAAVLGTLARLVASGKPAQPILHAARDGHRLASWKRRWLSSRRRDEAELPRLGHRAV